MVDIEIAPYKNLMNGNVVFHIQRNEPMSFLFGHMFSYLYIRVIVANTFSIIKNVSTHYSEKTHRYEHYPHVAVGINISENIYHSQHNSDMETSVDNQEKDCTIFYICGSPLLNKIILLIPLEYKSFVC